MNLTVTYMDCSFKPELMERIIAGFKIHVIDKIGKPEVIICPELSGIIVGAVLSHIYDMKMCVIRKRGVERHSYNIVEGWYPEKEKWLFLDDTIDTGKTICRCFDEILRIKDDRPDFFSGGNFMGAFLFSHFRYDNVKNNPDCFTETPYTNEKFIIFDGYIVRSEAERMAILRRKYNENIPG